MRILLFGDGLGIPQLINHIPKENICGIVAATNRTQYHQDLWALAKDLKVSFAVQSLYSYRSYRDFHSWVEQINPDLIWVNSYSMIVREDILKIPKLGGINIHGALLPEYRGCNPTQWAILNGENITGVTLHEMTEGLDEGAVIDQNTVPIYFEDTWLMIQSRISKATDQLISRNLSSIISGQWQSTPQASEQAHYHRRRKPEDGLFYWNQPIFKIYNLIRALVSPHPGAFYLENEQEKVILDSYMTPFAITALKYSDAGEMHLEGKKIRLRPMSSTDIEWINQWDIDKHELITCKTSNHPIAESENEAWFESILFKRTDLLVFIIEDMFSGCAIGHCQLFNINWNFQNAELHIEIKQDSNLYFRLICLEVFSLLCKFGFNEINLNRIHIHILSASESIINMCEKIGFVKEGILRQAARINNEFVDVIGMGLLKSEYE